MTTMLSNGDTPKRGVPIPFKDHCSGQRDDGLALSTATWSSQGSDFRQPAIAPGEGPIDWLSHHWTDCPIAALGVDFAGLSGARARWPKNP